MNKKFIYIILSLALLLPTFTSPVNANEYVREIDGVFNDIEIRVKGEKIQGHKEAFFYEDELWVPIKDLAKGLDLVYKLDENKRNFSLNSSGKLKTQGSNSDKIKLFQRGYEIEAKEKIKRDLEGIFTDPESTKVPKVKNINVDIGNWTMFLDGKKTNLDIAPIFYNDDVYVDIYSIAPHLYITPSYRKDKSILNIDPNGILLKDKVHSDPVNLLSFRQGRNHLLDIQIAQLEQRKELQEGLKKIPYAKLNNIGDVEKYLNKHFSKVGELPVTIKASEPVGNWIYLEISLSQSNSYKWRNLKRKEVEDWIWDMNTALVTLYNEDGLLHGVVRNPYYSRYSNSTLKNYISFDTRDKDLFFDFSKSYLEKDYKFNSSHLLDNLNKSLNKYNKVNFKYSIDILGDDIDLTVYPDSNIIKNWSIYTKMGYLKKLNWDIRRVYPDLAVNGSIVFPKDDIQPIKFRFDNNKIRSADLLRETEDLLNLQYSSFSDKNNVYELSFNIYEKGLDDLELVVEGDFSINDDKWINNEDYLLDRVNSRVHNGISTIISLWDMNVSTKLVDRHGEIITEVDTYQKNIGIVYANPVQGEIKEGTEVYLHTDTSGADIYYTLDGTTPTRQSNLYTGPITVSRDLTINAFGYKDGMGSGPITSLEYTVVDDDSWSYGLNNLKLDKGELSPSFSRDILDYEMNIDGSINNIILTPYADNGEITINGDKISSGSSKTMLLKEGRNIINISVKEKGKKEKTYTINLYRGSSGGVDVKIIGQKFSTQIVGVFKGQLASSYTDNFNGYRVELLSKTNVKYKETRVDFGGNFEITEFPIDPISKIIGYKYRVYDGTGNLILEDNLQ